MSRFYLLLLINLLFIQDILCQHLYKSIYNMEQIKNLKVEECTKNSDCPSYSNGCYIPNLPGYKGKGFCNLYYFCHDDGSNCYVLNKDDYGNIEEYQLNVPNGVNFNYPLYNITNEIKEPLILTTCNRNSIINKKCISDFCFKHKDCFSKQCYYGNCETDLNNKAYICSLLDVDDDNQIGNDVSYYIACKLAKQEECEYNRDCFTNNCDDISGLCIDTNEEGRLPKKVTNNIFGLPSILFYILVMMFSIVFCIFCCCRTPKPRRNRNIRLNE